VPLYLIRHGESEGNARRVFQGALDLPLTPLGESQAQTLGAWLAAHGVRPLRIYHSPLQRAARTAELIAAGLHAPHAAQPPPLAPAPQLREYAGGQLEGLTEEEQEARFPGFMARPLAERGDFGPYGGETYAEIQERLAQFAAGLDREELEHADLLAVAHGGSLYQLLKLLCAEPTPRHFQTHIGNCCCFKLSPRWFAEGLLMHLQWMVPLELIESSLALPPRPGDDPGLE
jgi:broad specificity phosphatase PhoE